LSLTVAIVIADVLGEFYRHAQSASFSLRVELKSMPLLKQSTLSPQKFDFTTAQIKSIQNCALCRTTLLTVWLSGYDVRFWLADFPQSSPDLWLTCDHFVDKVSAMGQPTGPTQLSIPLWSVNE